MKTNLTIYKGAKNKKTDTPPIISYGTKEFEIMRYMSENNSERFNIRRFSKKSGISRSYIYDIINRLIKKEIIIKAGPGNFKLSSIGNRCVGKVEIAARNQEPFIREQKTNTDTKDLNSEVLEVRGHGFRFLIKIKKTKFWIDRRKYMITNKIGFKPIPHGETILIRNHRVKLFNKSIDIYFVPGWSSYSYNAENSWRKALIELNLILKEFKNIFNIDLDKVEWKVCKQHYSLIKNALAKDYLLRKDKLHVWTSEGKLWMLIDNSFNLEECETVHRVSARDDNKKVQDFFNGVKSTGITPEFILDGFNKLIQDRTYYADNLRQHTDAIKTLDQQIKRLGDIIIKSKDTDK